MPWRRPTAAAACCWAAWPGVPPGKVAVLGGGIVGYNAALIAVGMQADVWVLDRSIDRMRELDPMLDGRATVAMSNTLQVEEAISEADLVIGAVLVHGARAPKLVTREMLGLMKPGSVLVDVAIDQGGCFETSRPTTHLEPTYEVDGIVHYCVANMPGAVPMTSTRALTNATLPYVEAIADRGLADAVRSDRALARGVNVMAGRVTYEPVARDLGHPYIPLSEIAGRRARLGSRLENWSSSERAEQRHARQSAMRWPSQSSWSPRARHRERCERQRPRVGRDAHDARDQGAVPRHAELHRRSRAEG